MTSEVMKGNLAKFLLDHSFINQFKEEFSQILVL